MTKKTAISLSLWVVGVIFVWSGVKLLRVTDKMTFLNSFRRSFPSYSLMPAVSFSPTPKSSIITPPTPVPTGNQELIKFTVPFTSQAPLGEWSDERQQDGCEEASALMTIYWTRGIVSITPDQARTEILAISDWEQREYNNYHDTSVTDTIARIYKGYYKYTKVHQEKNITVDDIIQTLKDGNLVVIPADGQALRNPYFTAPGPERHMLVIIGYDFKTDEFITNDPGTRRGQNYRYKKDILFDSIRDYSTSIDGIQQPIIGISKNIIVVSK